MTSTKKEETLLETDSRGRVRVSRERREALLDEYEKSGLSGARFARLTGINYTTFAAWRQSRRKNRAGECGSSIATAESRPAPLRLLEATVENSRPVTTDRLPAGLTVELPGGALIRVESPGQLRLAAELIALTGQAVRRPC